jgi:ATP-dependent exoDNAse (exonuclease V) alpha subunit
MAREINRSRLERIRSPASTYEAIWEGDFPRSSFPADPLLTLKTGAQVVFLKNAAGKRWVNGTMGKVVDLDSETVAVEVEQGHGRAVFEVAPDTWESRRYAFSASSNTISGEVVGSFTQIPLRLAWAMTIHKSQGLTFPGVVVDLGGGAFAAGQTYVALSRATSLEGLVLKSRIRESDLIVAEPVMRFYLERVLGASDRRGVLEHKPRGR